MRVWKSDAIVAVAGIHSIVHLRVHCPDAQCTGGHISNGQISIRCCIWFYHRVLVTISTVDDLYSIRIEPCDDRCGITLCNAGQVCCKTTPDTNLSKVLVGDIAFIWWSNKATDVLVLFETLHGIRYEIDNCSKSFEISIQKKRYNPLK